jgi:hypothetical protein
VRMMGGVMGGDDFMGNIKSGLGVWKNMTGIARRCWMDTRLCVMCVCKQMYISDLNHDSLRVQVDGLNINKHQYTDF